MNDAMPQPGATAALAQFTVLEDRGVLAVSGPDRQSFLQGLISNDVAKVATDRAVYAALLTAQGKYLHDFFLVEVGEAIWLDAEAARLADLKRRLSMYRLRAKVEIAERPELAVAAVFGEGALSAFGLPAEGGAAGPFEDGVVLTDPRLAALGIRIILDRGRLARLCGRDGRGPEFVPADFAVYDRPGWRSAFPTAVAICCPKSPSCWKAVSTSCTASIGKRAAISARSSPPARNIGA
jgi:hypothetical protein